MLGTLVFQGDNLSGYVEKTGIDQIPNQNRYGKPSGLFFVWAGTTTNIFTLTYGAMLVVVFQLSFFQALIAIIVGNALAYPLLGLTSLQGPRTGTTSITIFRSFNCFSYL
ncbi:cytosine permease [Gleimia hominis]|uniref:Cytosine permease n=1 Tax=Gleimia hominis TaxID=595468 RepID=A0ABU3IA91_9ACTO|nr:cytosine permease [Gleimia hominis]MDT3767299.1 cytosine permease [Gleimia hominis]